MMGIHIDSAAKFRDYSRSEAITDKTRSNDAHWVYLRGETQL